MWCSKSYDEEHYRAAVLFNGVAPQRRWSKASVAARSRQRPQAATVDDNVSVRLQAPGWAALRFLQRWGRGLLAGQLRSGPGSWQARVLGRSGQRPRPTSTFPKGNT